MPSVACESCGTVQDVSIFVPDPRCEQCGSSSFDPNVEQHAGTSSGGPEPYESGT